jgi:di/tricarboxylate transporter
MNNEQIFVFSLLAVLLAMLMWGRIRYDVVALAGLAAAIIGGVVPVENAFSGFGHPAVIIIVMVLVVSRGLVNSGAILIVTRMVANGASSVARHIVLLGGIGAALSGFMNNVAALALLMPVDLNAARRAKRSAAATLMPLSFACILGGLVTMIGTPPNIIVAQYRGDAVGTSFRMFDFAPVGLACALVGLAFVALLGWRLLPGERLKRDVSKELRELHGFVAELVVGKGSEAIGQKVSDLDEVADDTDVAVIGLVRKGKRLPGGARRHKIQENDILVVDASAEAIDSFVGALKLKYIGEEKHKETAGEDLALLEVVVPSESRIEGRSADAARLLGYWGVTLLGVSRRGKRFRDRVRALRLEAGDVLLLLGPAERLNDVAGRLGTLPLASGDITVSRHRRAGMAVGFFAAAVVAASLEITTLPVALILVVVAYAVTGILPPRQLYDAVQWPVVVLLGALIPIGMALEATGGTALVADALVRAASDLPPWAVLTLLMIVTMTLSDLLNNAATAIIAAPVAVEIAARLGASPDPFLMAVAVAASCAFLTPIGHQNNTLVMGPGGYAFSDYWRMGLPLEILIVATGVPAILLFWPL